MMAWECNLPTKVIAGIVVPYTPTVQKALDFARQSATEDVFNHVVRSLLLGFVIADKTPHLRDRDREIHAIAAILHDVGLPTKHRKPFDSTPTLSSDKRFEVDSADTARQFLLKEAAPADWDKHRLQLVWDAIALHALGSIALHKEVEVQACCQGIQADFMGPHRTPGGLLTWEEYEACIQAYPRLGIASGFRECMLTLCRVKPQTTFDNTVGEWGRRHLAVDEYSHTSVQALLESSLEDLEHGGSQERDLSAPS